MGALEAAVARAGAEGQWEALRILSAELERARQDGSPNVVRLEPGKRGRS